MSAPADVIFDVRPAHVLEGPAIVSGWLCEVCGGYWATLDAALAVPCKAAA